MTHTTDQDRAEFEAWLGIKPCGAAHDLAWKAWQAARRAQVVPNVVQVQDAEKKIAELLALARIMVRAALDADNKTEMPEIKAAIESEVEFERALRNTIAAAPQPPEAAQLDDIDVADMAQAVDSTEAAPVQMPEPVAFKVCDKNEPDIGFWLSEERGTYWQTTEPLYTEHQVRQLLAAHGIQEQST